MPSRRLQAALESIPLLHTANLSKDPEICGGAGVYVSSKINIKTMHFSKVPSNVNVLLFGYCITKGSIPFCQIFRSFILHQKCLIWMFFKTYNKLKKTPVRYKLSYKFSLLESSLY